MQVVRETGQSIRVLVDAGQVDLIPAELQQMAAFAARRGTGIEKLAAAAGQQPRRRNLCCGVLDRHPAGIETGQICNGHRFCQMKRLFCAGQYLRANPALLQLRKVIDRTHALRIDSQPHWRPFVICRENLLPVVWPVSFDGSNKPTWMIMPSLVTARPGVRHFLATEAAKNRVQQARVLGPPQQSRRFHGLGYRGMVRNARIGKLEQADQQQCADNAIAFLQRPIEQRIGPLLQTPVISQRTETKHA